MSENILKYVSDLQKKITSFTDANLQALDQAANVCSKTLLSKNVIHIYDTGHIISHEMIMRTGGLVAYTHLSFDGMVDSNNLWRSDKPENNLNAEEALLSEKSIIHWLFTQKKLNPGDILILGSVSGLGIRLVELALQAKAYGLTVIAITGVDFSMKLASKHPSGKRLCEVADIVLDNQTEYGDAFYSMPNLERKICPSSGIAATILMWSLTVGIVEKIVQARVQPSIYKSVNLPDGPSLVEEIEKAYKQKGI